MNKTLFWFLSSGLSAVLFKLSVPPVNFGYVVLFAFVPLILLAHRSGIISVFFSGLVAGGFWVSDLPLALVEWGWALPTYAFLLGSLVVALLVAIYGYMRVSNFSIGAMLVFPSLYVSFVFIGQEIIPAPIAMSPLLIDSFIPIGTIGKYLGFYGLEFVLALFNSATASILIYFYGRNIDLKRKVFDCVSKVNLNKIPFLFATGVVFILFVFIATGKFAGTPENLFVDDNEEVTVYAVQPAISHRDALRAGNSLHFRQKHENRLDGLTLNALDASESGIILWPEGGHNFPNLGIKRRREMLINMMDGQASEVLLAGYEILANGQRLNTVTHLSEKGFGKTVLKSRLAPFAESHLQSGEPSVIHSKFGVLGIAICFEAIFTRHYRSLKAQGADVFVVVTDDSSFGETQLFERHLSYARVNAAIYRTPLVFLNNHGNSYLIGHDGRIQETDLDGKTPHVNKWKFQSTKPFHPSLLILHDTVLIIVLFYIIAIVGQRLVDSLRRYTEDSRIQYTLLRRSLCRFPSSGNLRRGVIRDLSLALSSVCLLVSALVLDGAIYLYSRNLDLNQFSQEVRQRYQGEGSLDGMAPLYRQRFDTSCGAAALAYALTRMGDSVFEYDLIYSVQPQHHSGYSLGELKRLANLRGFVADAKRVTLEDLPEQGRPPVIAHYAEEHYVVILHRDSRDIVYFDPALGQVLSASKESFAERWSGIILDIRYDERHLVDSIQHDQAPTKLASRLNYAHRFSTLLGTLLH